MSYKGPRSQVVFHSTLKTTLGQISVAGYQRESRGVSTKSMRILGKYALVYLIDGSGRMKWGDHPPVPCRAGDLLFIHPKVPHGYGPGPDESWSEFFIVFDGAIFDLWLACGYLQAQNPIRHLPKIRHALAELARVTESGIPATSAGMVRRICRLQKFLSDIAQEPEIPSRTAPWMSEAQQLLVDSPELAPEKVARKLGLSYETFRKEFARQTGQPPLRYRLHRRIDQARLLIRERHLSNKQIAETLGFYDEFHFSRRFREIVGQSTRAFRHSL